ncbi:MAG: nucleotidyltransferase family protein [Candidatus Omnitrophota bacterium]|nr:nucleotidyltransferase family protein [Candidatus Omnitrophota bacterium]
MKALIMAAGYAVRLYPLTKNRPKPLLPVCRKPIVEYILANIEKIKSIDEVLVVTNHKFAGHFTDWSKNLSFQKKIRIMNDGTTTNDDKLGAVGDINFVIKNAQINDDLLIIAGDNLFDFSLDGFIEAAFSKKPSPSIGLYDIGDLEAVKKYGMVALSQDKKVVDFQEKPRYPSSTLVAICLYFLPQETLKLVPEYLDEGNNPDAPGYYIDWLCRKKPTYGFVFKGEWYDIGDIASYHRASKKYERKADA